MNCPNCNGQHLTPHRTWDGTGFVAGSRRCETCGAIVAEPEPVAPAAPIDEEPAPVPDTLVDVPAEPEPVSAPTVEDETPKRGRGKKADA